MLNRVCRVATPSYQKPATCLGSARPTTVMRSLIAPPALGPVPNHVFGPAGQRLAGTSLNRC